MITNLVVVIIKRRGHLLILFLAQIRTIDDFAKVLYMEETVSVEIQFSFVYPLIPYFQVQMQKSGNFDDFFYLHIKVELISTPSMITDNLHETRKTDVSGVMRFLLNTI